MSANRHIFNGFGQVFLIALLGATAVAGSGCGGSLSPLYADFRIETPPGRAPQDSIATGSADSAATTRGPGETATIQDRIAAALTEAGWELDEAPSDNAVSTTEVQIIEWGLYDVRVSLDVVPVNDKFVRVYVHPYRQYFWGSRSKMSYMNRRVRSYVFPDLAETFKTQGIVPLGAPSGAEGDQEHPPETSEEKAAERQFR